MWNCVQNFLWSVNSSGISLQNLPLCSKTLVTINFKVTPIFPCECSSSRWSLPCHAGAGRGRCWNHRSQRFRNHTQISLWQWGFAWGNVGFPHHAAEQKQKKKKGQMLFIGQMALSCPSRLSKSCTALPTRVWGMGRDRKEAQVLLNAWAGASSGSEAEGRTWHEGEKPFCDQPHAACLPAPTCSLSPQIKPQQQQSRPWCFQCTPRVFQLLSWLIALLLSTSLDLQ